MELTDSHTHLFLPRFSGDLDEVIQRAINRNIRHFFLPNIDTDTIESMHRVCEQYPQNCYPMMGLHPCSVGDNFEAELEEIGRKLESGTYAAIGETGMDLYHDVTYKEQQEAALERHIEWAKAFDLPLVLHTRNCNEEVYRIVKEKGQGNIRGVFHCFNGDYSFAKRVMDLGFYIGIGGVVTFKNSRLGDVVKEIPLQWLLLETDAPYLAPHPYRGKRNESSYIYEIASAISLLKEKPIEEIADKTTQNVFELYNTRYRDISV